MRLPNLILIFNLIVLDILLLASLDNSARIWYSIRMTKKQQINHEVSNAYADIFSIKQKIESLQSFGDVQISAQNSEFEYIRSGLISAMNSLVNVSELLRQMN